MLVATANALVERGQTLWPPHTLTPERLLRYYPAHTWRVARQAGQALATCCLLDADPLFWPDDSPGMALYLHKLGVVPEAQGRGLAQHMLAFAVHETRERGLPLLKLDTAAERTKLRHLYTTYGFQEVGEKQVGPYLVTLMQLECGEGRGGGQNI